MATKTPAKDKAAPSASVDDQGSVNDSQQDAGLSAAPAASASATESKLHQDNTEVESTGEQGSVKEPLQGDVLLSAPAAPAHATDSTLDQDGSALAAPLSQDLGPNAAPAAAPGDLLAEGIQDKKLPRYYVTDVSSVIHNDKWYHAGDGISLSDDEAAPLLQRRIIEPIQEFNQ
ncbi:hypothetical protein ALP29_00226 [Pseudomonas syringae pv. avii]|uniref:Uncharacterized protein n=1 Tax=Pseudomonas syringae pv. avii TaxID=663959 RepID=A0A3M5VHS8_PSESX|nr:hypothetical protein [Pseudomonas azotoformans]RMT61673.1 hypothetical protein ALP43_03217 [Pseudomonas azotoformans]RMU57769.1 hypothetical protein ALP29_00226 [Pseudomonas syringae pv. avii]